MKRKRRPWPPFGFTSQRIRSWNYFRDLARVHHAHHPTPCAHARVGIVQRRHVADQQVWRASDPWRNCQRDAWHWRQYSGSRCCGRCNRRIRWRCAHSEWLDIHHGHMVHDVSRRLVPRQRAVDREYAQGRRRHAETAHQHGAIDDLDRHNGLPTQPPVAWISTRRFSAASGSSLLSNWLSPLPNAFKRVAATPLFIR